MFERFALTTFLFKKNPSKKAYKTLFLLVIQTRTIDIEHTYATIGCNISYKVVYAGM